MPLSLKKETSGGRQTCSHSCEIAGFSVGGLSGNRQRNKKDTLKSCRKTGCSEAAGLAENETCRVGDGAGCPRGTSCAVQERAQGAGG